MLRRTSITAAFPFPFFLPRTFLLHCSLSWQLGLFIVLSRDLFFLVIYIYKPVGLCWAASVYHYYCYFKYLGHLIMVYLTCDVMATQVRQLLYFSVVVIWSQHTCYLWCHGHSESVVVHDVRFIGTDLPAVPCVVCLTNTSNRMCSASVVETLSALLVLWKHRLAVLKLVCCCFAVLGEHPCI